MPGTRVDGPPTRGSIEGGGRGASGVHAWMGRGKRTGKARAGSFDGSQQDNKPVHQPQPSQGGKGAVGTNVVQGRSNERSRQ